MLVAGLLKELKIANVGILEGMSRNRLKQDISTFHELQRFLSGLSGLSGPDRLAPVSQRHLTSAIVVAEVSRI